MARSKGQWLTYSERWNIANEVYQGKSLKEVANEFNVSYATVVNIKDEFLDTKLTWKPDIKFSDSRQQTLWQWFRKKLAKQKIIP